MTPAAASAEGMPSSPHPAERRARPEPVAGSDPRRPRIPASHHMVAIGRRPGSIRARSRGKATGEQHRCPHGRETRSPREAPRSCGPAVTSPPPPSPHRNARRSGPCDGEAPAVPRRAAKGLSLGRRRRAALLRQALQKGRHAALLLGEPRKLPRQPCRARRARARAAARSRRRRRSSRRRSSAAASRSCRSRAQRALSSSAIRAASARVSPERPRLAIENGQDGVEEDRAAHGLRRASRVAEEGGRRAAANALEGHQHCGELLALLGEALADAGLPVGQPLERFLVRGDAPLELREARRHLPPCRRALAEPRLRRSRRALSESASARASVASVCSRSQDRGALRAARRFALHGVRAVRSCGQPRRSRLRSWRREGWLKDCGAKAFGAGAGSRHGQWLGAVARGQWLVGQWLGAVAQGRWLMAGSSWAVAPYRRLIGGCPTGGS